MPRLADHVSTEPPAGVGRPVESALRVDGAPLARTEPDASALRRAITVVRA
ncbi:hypothetical protein [Rathayibacter tanaceti]|uniref:Uncharacterized protein n=1 Tax=Rathayibacter tanaceti TaxID=1671680 RepID=A0AAE6RM67_9MICO|nr:hypothetical protein [Rathayibacter tanaceti]QHC55739.1 hypothetical protein GSU10_08920 [Rathayibacter tanaceti]